MARWQVVIKGNRFELLNGEKKRRVVNYGWECFTKSNTAISCINTKHYTGEGLYKLIFKIFKDGKIVWLKQKGDNEAEILKTAQLAQWPIDGIIELPTSLGDEGVMYSRKEAIKIFLSESSFHGL